LAVASDDGRIRLWTPGDETPAVLASLDTVAAKLAASPDGRWLAAACHDDIVRVFDLAARSLYARLYHLEAGWAAVRADGKYDYGGDVSRLSCADGMRTYRLADLDELIPDGRLLRGAAAPAELPIAASSPAATVSTSVPDIDHGAAEPAP